MEKPEIIKMFLDRGLQITGEALDFFIQTPEKINLFFSRTKNYPSIITLDFIKQTLEAPFEFQLIKTSTAKEATGIDDFVDYFNKRYTFLCGILKKRLDLVNLVSINKISEKIKRFSIIGMVKEKTTEDSAIIVEDRSGEVEILLSENSFSQLVEDEVVGILCEKKGTAVYGEKIIFPDVPVQREINKTKEDNFIFTISDIHINSETFNEKSYEKLINWLENYHDKLNIFLLEDSSSRNIENFLADIPKRHETYIIRGEIEGGVRKNLLPNPAFIQKEDVKLLLFHTPRINEYIKFFGAPEQAIINLIKKRHLDPTFSPNSKIYDNDPYLLDIIPDIVVTTCAHSPTVVNYKGITIVTTGSLIAQPIFWLINLRTRETFKIDFS